MVTLIHTNMKIFICILLGIILLIFVVVLVANYINAKIILKNSKKQMQDLLSHSPYRKPQPLIKPHNNFKARDKEQEELELQDNTIQKYYPDNQIYENKEEQIGTKIVGIVEPKGFWSKLIISQKLSYIMARFAAQETNKGGFWSNLIKAQAASQGKDQSRGR